jgi:transposase
MSKVRFKPDNKGQRLLFPDPLDERIALDAPVRLIDRIVDGLDLTDLISTYESGGTTPYHPRMLLKIVFYAYMNNIYSCRKIASMMEHHIHYMWLSAKQYPSYCTINRFRSEHIKNCVNRLFVQVVGILVEMGQVSLEVQYVDGTKIESVANKYTFVWRKTTESNKKKLEEKIRNILSQIDEGIAQDKHGEAETAASPIDSATLGKLIDKVNQENSHRRVETEKEKEEVKKCSKQIKELEKHKEKLEEYEQKLDILGGRNSYSKTDPDATFMRMKEDEMNNGQTKPGYNLQAGTENQYITNFGLFPNPGDTLTLAPFLTLGMARFGKLPKILSADAGYGSEENYELLERNNIEAFVKYNYFHKEQKALFKNDISRQENLYYNEEKDYVVCPMGQHMHFIGETESVNEHGHKSIVKRYQAVNCEGCPLRGQCTKAKGNRIVNINHRLAAYKKKTRELLLSEEGIMHRKKRPIEPEAVFGQMKFNMAYKRFRHRLFENVQMDFGLFAMAFNLKKLCANLAKKALSTLYQQKQGLPPFFRTQKRTLKLNLEAQNFIQPKLAA